MKISDPVERVALAIEKSMFAPHELPLDDELHGKYRETAKAAIAAHLKALREPTKEMLDAGRAVTAKWLNIKGSWKTVARKKMKRRWHAMIDHLRVPK